MSSDNHTTYCVYRIQNLANNNAYIGKTNNPKTRKSRHFSELRTNTHYNCHLQAAYNKYGEFVFTFEILESEISKYDINNREIYWIAESKKYQILYNQTIGGDGNGTNIKPIAWNGVHYSSVTEAAIANRVGVPTMTTRINNGYTCDDDMPGSGSKIKHRKSVIWNSIQYPSITAAAIGANVNKATMQYYLEHGYTCDRDIGSIVKAGGYGAKPVIWNSIEYPSLAEAARALGINPASLKERLARGYVCDSDLKRPMTWDNNAKGNPCSWNGIEYASVSAAAKANGIHVSSMNDRLRRGYICDADLKPRTRTR